jgi:hypothetical protein
VELSQVVALIVILLFFAALVQARRKRGRGHTRPGAGATGAIYDMLMEDKRKAIEIILEERAEERDPETADGDLPALEAPKRKPPR